MIIETFPVRQFPNAAGHYEVSNETPWDEDDNDRGPAHHCANERRATEPTLSHFLLLIVAGELKGVQHIPLEPGVDRQAEERYTRNSLPPIHCPLRKKPPPSPLCRREGGGHSHLPRTIT